MLYFYLQSEFPCFAVAVGVQESSRFLMVMQHFETHLTDWKPAFFLNKYGFNKYVFFASKSGFNKSPCCLPWNGTILTWRKSQLPMLTCVQNVFRLKDRLKVPLPAASSDKEPRNPEVKIVSPVAGSEFLDDQLQECHACILRTCRGMAGLIVWNGDEFSVLLYFTTSTTSIF